MLLKHNTTINMTVVDSSKLVDNVRYLYALGARKIKISSVKFNKVRDDFFHNLDGVDNKLAEFSEWHKNLKIDLALPCYADGVTTGCAAGVTFFGVNYNGDIYPCESFALFNKYLIGNVDNGIDKNKLVQFFSETETMKTDYSACYVENLYYHDNVKYNYELRKNEK